MSLSRKMQQIVEENGFVVRCIDNEGKGSLTVIRQCTPCGEDWMEDIWFTGDDDSFVNSVLRLYDGFDVNDETELFIPVRGKYGVPSSIKEILNDAEWKKDKLKSLVDSLVSFDKMEV